MKTLAQILVLSIITACSSAPMGYIEEDASYPDASVDAEQEMAPDDEEECHKHECKYKHCKHKHKCKHRKKCRHGRE